jgi:hypothetical protein
MLAKHITACCRPDQPSYTSIIDRGKLFLEQFGRGTLEEPVIIPFDTIQDFKGPMFVLHEMNHVHNHHGTCLKNRWVTDCGVDSE